MKHIVITCILALVFVTPSAAHSIKPSPTIQAYDAYAYATSVTQKNGAVFFQFKNMSDNDVEIVAASSDVSETVELHNHTTENGTMKMRQIDFVHVPPHQTAMFEPMGKHIMLMGLKAPLTEGQSFDITLTFAHAPALTVPVTIVKPGAKPQAHMMDHDHDHSMQHQNETESPQADSHKDAGEHDHHH